jgi:type IV secretory pathway VirB10-like protein
VTAQDNSGEREPVEGHRPVSEMRLRNPRAPVTRVSRKVLLGLGTVVAVGISASLFFALRPQQQTGGSELYNTSNRTTPDGLANLPRDYTGLPHNAPQLGPPLPGDLGRPILNAGVPAPGMPTPAAGPTPEQQRIAQEMEAARTSHLFTTTSFGQSAVASIPGLDAHLPSSIPATSGDLTNPDHKLAFLNGDVDRRTVSPDRVEAPASTDILQAGAVIAAALLTGIRSDLPGQVTAQVTEDVYDSPTGRILLIPQGARLVGQYDAQIAFGQSRALLVWNRLIMPTAGPSCWNANRVPIRRVTPALRIRSTTIGACSSRRPSFRHFSASGRKLAPATPKTPWFKRSGKVPPKASARWASRWWGVRSTCSRPSPSGRVFRSAYW